MLTKINNSKIITLMSQMCAISLKFVLISQVTFSEGQSVAIISLTVIADGMPELRESVTIALIDVTTVGLQDLRQAAVIDKQRAQALLTILPNGSPYGVIGWHLDSQFTLTQEPQRKSRIYVARNYYMSDDLTVDVYLLELLYIISKLSKDILQFWFLLVPETVSKAGC